MLFLMSMLFKLSKLSSVIKLNVVFISNKFVDILMIVNGIVVYIINGCLIELNSSIVIVNMVK